MCEFNIFVVLSIQIIRANNRHARKETSLSENEGINGGASVVLKSYSILYIYIAFALATFNACTFPQLSRFVFPQS